MKRYAATAADGTPSTPLLEAIRRAEAEAKRRLTLEGEAARIALAEAERRAQEVIAAAEIEGREEGARLREQAQARVEAEAQAIMDQARAEAKLLQRAGALAMEAAIAQAVATVIEVRQ
jgi:vacuolar-type H+-ATPase subunit H